MSKLSHKSTPLLEVLRRCTPEEQNEIAAHAQTSRNYLYQIATCHRETTNLRKGVAIVEAVNRLHVRSLGRIPKVTIEELAYMCPCA